MLKGLVSAFRTITAIPVPGASCERAEDSLVWFPWVGMALGAIAWALAHWGCAPWIHPQMRLFWIFALSAIIVSVWALLTRGFHLDGLADMCDGFGGGWTRERILEIMRDSRIGSFGVIALILTLLLKTLAVAMLLGVGWHVGLMLAPVVSRWGMVYQTVFNVYARKEVAQVSMANHFIDCAKPAHFWGASLSLILCLGAIGIMWHLSWLYLAKVVAVAWAVTATLGAISRHKVGGVTGDILGATCELVETASLLAAGLCL